MERYLTYYVDTLHTSHGHPLPKPYLNLLINKMNKTPWGLKPIPMSKYVLRKPLEITGKVTRAKKKKGLYPTKKVDG